MLRGRVGSSGPAPPFCPVRARTGLGLVTVAAPARCREGSPCVGTFAGLCHPCFGGQTVLGSKPRAENRAWSVISGKCFLEVFPGMSLLVSPSTAGLWQPPLVP